MVRLAALALIFGACDAKAPSSPAPVIDPVSAMAFNVANRLGEPGGAQIADQIGRSGADFVAVLEANDADWLERRLPGRYEWTAPPSAGVGLVFDATRWRVLDSGTIELGDGDDGWGPRRAGWGRFADTDGRAIAVYSTHWCVTIRSDRDACDWSRQLEYADRIFDHMDSSVPAILAGDLNVFDGFEDGPVISHVRRRGMVDAFRTARPAMDGATFAGNTWAPPGRLDYIFATAPVTVLDAAVVPGASDHGAVTATLMF